jgi:hypothetical protein
VRKTVLRVLVSCEGGAQASLQAVLRRMVGRIPAVWVVGVALVSAWLLNVYIRRVEAHPPATACTWVIAAPVGGELAWVAPAMQREIQAGDVLARVVGKETNAESRSPIAGKVVATMGEIGARVAPGDPVLLIRPSGEANCPSLP